jgi:hypothetical protein
MSSLNRLNPLATKQIQKKQATQQAEKSKLKTAN